MEFDQIWMAEDNINKVESIKANKQRSKFN